MTNCFLLTTDDVIICDPEAEYAPLVERLHGQVIKISPTSTNYINWKATNRFTCGLGFQASKNFSVDLAYQYSQTDGDFYPFMSYDGDTNPANNCVVNATQVSHKRHQLMATLTYRF